jgi:hypothetical protein
MGFRTDRAGLLTSESSERVPHILERASALLGPASQRCGRGRRVRDVFRLGGRGFAGDRATRRVEHERGWEADRVGHGHGI